MDFYQDLLDISWKIKKTIRIPKDNVMTKPCCLRLMSLQCSDTMRPVPGRLTLISECTRDL